MKPDPLVTRCVSYIYFLQVLTGLLECLCPSRDSIKNCSSSNYSPDMTRGIIICFVLGDTLTLSLPFISSRFSVAESTAKNLTGFMCDVSLLTVSMLLGSRVSPFNGLASFDITVTWHPALFVICRRIENKLEGGGNTGGTSKVKKTEQNINMTSTLTLRLDLYITFHNLVLRVLSIVYKHSVQSQVWLARKRKIREEDWSRSESSENVLLMRYTKFRVALLTTTLNTMEAPVVQLQALVVYKVDLNLLHMYE